ncbi:hypothetical protein G7067_09085 [Leucobacter insecticola]|uniref:DUF7507 domain-containing protein n=1 Tax=Leucobacter insecticola TaxID=2714934 RepID=A0A6G8FJ95_9MICO|nr:hypothetical protein G7067_09085 [Leucobacter insecticola]
MSTTMLPGPVSLSLVKSASPPANGVSYTAGERIMFSFEVTNTGSRDLKHVTVSEERFVNGAGASLSLATPISPRSPADFDGILASGESATFAADYLVTLEDQLAGGEITNSAAASGVSFGGEQVQAHSDVAVSVALPRPAIDLVKSVANRPAQGTAFTPGERVQYEFTVRNTGNVPLSSVNVTEESFTNGNLESVRLDGPITAPTASTEY